MEIREKTRKCYKKPQIYQVKLEVEEAVLLGCKTNSTANNPAGAGSNSKCNHAQGCHYPGGGSGTYGS